MPQFRFIAKGADGKTVDGVITCNDRAAAIRQVEKERGFPIEAPVGPDAMWWLRANGKHREFAGALCPPQLRNHGNYIIALSRVVQWMKEHRENPRSGQGDGARGSSV